MPTRWLNCAVNGVRADTEDESRKQQWRFLDSLLTPQQREEIARIGKLQSIGPQDIQSLTDMLNQLLQRPEIHESTEFASVISGTDQALLEKLQGRRQPVAGNEKTTG